MNEVSVSKSSMLLIDLNIFSNETSSSRMSYRRQKHWWNAYILFYERIDENSEIEKLELTKSLQDLTIGKILFLGLKCLNKGIRNKIKKYDAKKEAFHVERLGRYSKMLQIFSTQLLYKSVIYTPLKLYEI